MRRTDLVNAIESMVDSFSAADVKDALAAVCAAKAAAMRPDHTWREWSRLSEMLNAVPNLGV